MKREPKVSIIIPAYNDEKHIINLFNSLLNLNYKNYKILMVVDKNSKDHSYKIAKTFENQSRKVKVIQNNKKGSAANRNRGFLESDKNTKYYAFTDSDCHVDKDWIKILVETIEHAPESVKCVGGINLTPRSDNKIGKLTGWIEQTLLGGGNSAQAKIFKKTTEVKSIPNCNAMYKREIWEENKQNESLIVGQDGEFNYRLRKKGVKFLVNPKSVVWHHRPSTIKKYLQRMYKYGKASAKILISQKDKSQFIKTRWYGFVTPLFFASIILLGLLSIIINIFSYLTFIIFLSYIIALLLTTIQVLAIAKKPIALLTPFVIFLQHVAYAWGVTTELFE
jgi:cellulose synthase/poly-beta-1,6-N-acetylglucosamine synthase-like glycosyltransferase